MFESAQKDTMYLQRKQTKLKMPSFACERFTFQSLSEDFKDLKCEKSFKHEITEFLRKHTRRHCYDIENVRDLDVCRLNLFGIIYLE